MKQLLLLTLLLFCAGSLRAQGDFCSAINLTSGDNCIDVGPMDIFDATFCEWYEEPDAPRVPIVGDQVSFFGIPRSFSGYHPHLGSALSDALRPNMLIAPVNGVTNSAGCLTTRIGLPGISGTYSVTAQGLATAPMARRLSVAAHYLPPKALINFANLRPLTQTSFMAPQSDYYDGFHGGQNFWVRNLEEPKFNRVAQVFWALSGGVKLAYLRCSLPEGGVSDNDLGSAFGIVPGYWYNSVRSFVEWHAIGDECDVINPSYLTNDLLLKVKVKQLEAAVAQSNCSFGKFNPAGSGGIDVNVAFWEGQNNIHLACGLAVGDQIPTI